jgi:hypothetical protein
MPIQRYRRDPADCLAIVSHDRSRRARLTRCWVAVACVLIATAGTAAAWRIHEQAQPCWAVRQLIDSNRTTQDGLKAKTYFPPAGSFDEPKVPTDADYRAWADGLRQRADRVTAPGLAGHAHRAADLAREFLDESKVVNDKTAQQPMGESRPPPEVNDLANINREFVTELRALDQACPGPSH